MKRKIITGLVLTWAGLAFSAGAQDSGTMNLPNLPTPTLGGLHLWADVRWQDGWRIQKHVWTGHHRLLDPSGVRRAWGGLNGCLKSLPEGEAERENDRVVILVHGLARTRWSMKALANDLETEGRETICVSTANTRREPEAVAADLEALLDHLVGVEQVTFVTHSLGSIVVRELLARPGVWKDRMVVEDAVLLGPPSRGAALARRLRSNPLTRLLAYVTLGDAVEVLAHTPEEVAPPWPEGTPGMVIAGMRGRTFGWNPLVPGDDDGVVGISETRLEGTDWIAVEGFHTYLMNRPRVRELIRERLGE